MRGNKEIRGFGHDAVKQNRIQCILSILMWSVFSGVVGGVVGFLSSIPSIISGLMIIFGNNNLLSSVLTMLAIIVSLVGACALILVQIGSWVGIKKFNMDNVENGDTRWTEAFSENKNLLRYAKLYGYVLLKMLIWIIIPVVNLIKFYDYQLVGYIALENPDMSAKEVLQTSKEMMQGYKWQSFCLDFYYIICISIGLIALIIPSVVHFIPCYLSSRAAFYLAVLEQYE